jgi:hypothetical protein
MARIFRRIGLVLLLVATGATPALACAGLIGPNGAVNLVRTTTLAAYYNGEQHYITAFSFQGGGGKFGSIIPLPAIPTRIERGGDWTLQRLIRETQIQFLGRAAQAAPVAEDSARVIIEKRIDALDITILQGGGSAVGRWAKDNGFVLPPDTPEVLDFYARRSQIFMAARFDADEARRRGQQIGDGTPIHLTIPVKNPWVPLRILSLGKKAGDVVRADVYLLTPIRPALLPGARRGLSVRYDAAASPSLMRDLRTDKGMEWMPAAGMWLTHLAINSDARELTYDLAVDASGRGRPSREASGLPWWEDPYFPLPDRPGSAPFDAPLFAAGVVVAGVLIARARTREMP